VCLVGCATGPVDLVVRVPNAEADLWVDGNYVGRVADVAAPDRRIRLAPGKHRVEVRLPGRFPLQRTVEVKRGSRTPVLVEGPLLEDPV
jgi:hypothetical protein